MSPDSRWQRPMCSRELQREPHEYSISAAAARAPHYHLLPRPQGLRLEDRRPVCAQWHSRVHIRYSGEQELLELLACEEAILLRQQHSGQNVILIEACHAER